MCFSFLLKYCSSCFCHNDLQFALILFSIDLDKNVLTDECKDGAQKNRIEKMIKNVLFGFCFCST